MSEQLLKNKIDDLNFWLSHNKHHPDYCLKHQEREQIKKQQLKNLNNE